MAKILVYDADGISNRARTRMKNTVSVFFIFAAILIAALLLLLFNDDNIYLFILSVVLICISFIVLFKQLNALKKLNYQGFDGVIKKVVKETTNERSYAGSVGLVRRKYDHYNKASIRLTLFIEDSEDIHPIVLNSVSEEHVNYYEELGGAMLIFGTTYPVKCEVNPERWLCPICGSFNSAGTECRECKNQILI